MVFWKRKKNNPILKVHVIDDNHMPRYKSMMASGLDLMASLEWPIVIIPGGRIIVPTGVRVSIPNGYEGQLRARSGISTKHGVILANGVGTIDADYRGEIKVSLINLGNENFEILDGDSIAQLVISPVARVGVVRVENINDLGSTLRGTNGFGSTGR